MAEAPAGPTPDYAARKRQVDHLVDALFGDLTRLHDAVVADGWPHPMVTAGFRMHEQTWRPETLVAAFEAELGAFGGPDALDAPVETDHGRFRLVRPERITHIWPALPGAGLTPVLFGILLGARQSRRASSRGRHFARLVCELADELDGAGPALALLGADDDWRQTDLVVVSGSDATLDEVRAELDRAHPDRRVPVTGYGHRVSLGVVVDHPLLDVEAVSRGLARDTVLWHQSGCFSLRGVIFCGRPERMARFAQAFGEAIARVEQDLGATDFDEGQLAQIVQARGVAEFMREVWGSGGGWVDHGPMPFRGQQVAPHVVTLHQIDAPDELAEAVDVPPHQLQGAALACPDAQRHRWADRLAGLGATRICRPGELQQPPGGWAHDGRPNVLGWVRVVTSP